MLKKITKLLTNNLGLKIVSVLVAVAVWLVVVNLDNPDKTQSFTIPIEVKNADVLAKQGKVYEIYRESDKATIYVTGKRTLMETLSPSDFKAEADLSQIDYKKDGDIKEIPVQVTAVRHEKELVINQKTNNMLITIEDLSTKQFNISGDPQGTPAEGYAIGEVVVSPNLVTVSGPRSLVTRIKRVSAAINVEGAVSDVTDSVVPVLYDENEEVIESSQLILNHERVTVKVQMLGTKEVPVRCLTTGEPMDGYQFIELKYEPQRIMIKGVSSVLNNISELQIPDAINLTGANGDVENSIDVTPYLEQLGVMLLNPEENKIAVKAIVERLETKSMELSVNSIEVLNLNEDYELRFGTGSVTVLVRGRSEALQDFTVAELIATLDLEGIEPGDYNREVQLKVPEPYQVIGTVTVQIHVVEKGTEPEEDSPGFGDQTVPTGPSGGSTGNHGGSTGGSGNTGGAGNNNENNDDEVTGNE